MLRIVHLNYCKNEPFMRTCRERERERERESNFSIISISAHPVLAILMEFLFLPVKDVPP